MLSSDHAEAARATFPAVTANGAAITGAFYAAMFAAHPELRNLFKQGNQANGEQRRALAGSVAAFAEHLVTEEPAVPFQRILSRIAHNYASLGVRPEQYTIVRRPVDHGRLSPLGCPALSGPLSPAGEFRSLSAAPRRRCGTRPPWYAVLPEAVTSHMGKRPRSGVGGFPDFSTPGGNRGTGRRNSRGRRTIVNLRDVTPCAPPGPPRHPQIRFRVDD